MNYLFMKLSINIKTVTPYHYQSFKAEHVIKSLSATLTKHVTGLGEIWQKYLPLATLAYIVFERSYIANFSPFEVVFSRK